LNLQVNALDDTDGPEMFFDFFELQKCHVFLQFLVK
jgi:hypothetical protein